MGNNSHSSSMEGGWRLLVLLVNFGLVARVKIVLMVFTLLAALIITAILLLHVPSALREGMARVQLLIAQALALLEDTALVQMINAQAHAVLVLIH